MKVSLRSLFFVFALCAVFSFAQATSSLSFSGGGYGLDLEIGHTDKPVVASVHFYPPADKQGVVLRRGLSVKAFDTRRKILLLEYKGGDPRVKPFSLTVQGETATFSTGKTRVTSSFSWFM